MERHRCAWSGMDRSGQARRGLAARGEEMKKLCAARRGYVRPGSVWLGGVRARRGKNEMRLGEVWFGLAMWGVAGLDVVLHGAVRYGEVPKCE